jgi:hypothetical protein
MRIGRPRKLVDLSCACCSKRFRPKHATTRFCSRRCKDQGQRLARAPRRPLYAYDGRLSDALWREIHAARAEQATAPLYRPGSAQ